MSTWGPLPYVQPTREQIAAAVRPALPTLPRRYYGFLRTHRHAWWKPLLLVLVGLAWLVVGSVLGLVAMVADGGLARSLEQAQAVGDPLAGLVVTPALFVANNLSLALAIPLAMLAQWAIWGQRPRWLASVAGGFRWGWFARCLAWAFPIVGAFVAGAYLLEPAADVRWRDHTVFMILVVLLTTPLQCAGEEYLVRGLLQRGVGSWFAHETLGWAVATAVGSLTFMALHLAQDPWLNVFYLAFGVTLSWLTWRTGGLEAAIAIHTANNVTGMALLPFTDFSTMFDRSQGTGSPWGLVQVVVVAGVAAILAWQGRRRQVLGASAPGAAEVEQAWRAWNPC